MKAWIPLTRRPQQPEPQLRHARPVSVRVDRHGDRQAALRPRDRRCAGARRVAVDRRRVWRAVAPSRHRNPAIADTAIAKDGYPVVRVVTAASLILAIVVADLTSPVPVPVPQRGPLPVAAAVVPGALLHGSGHFAARRPPDRVAAVARRGAGAWLAGRGRRRPGADGRVGPDGRADHLDDRGGRRAVRDVVARRSVRRPRAARRRRGRRCCVLPVRRGAASARATSPTRRWPGTLLAGAGARCAVRALALLARRPGCAVDGGSNNRFEAEVAFRFVGPRAGPAAAPATDGSFFDLVAGGDSPPLRRGCRRSAAAPPST